MYALHRSAVVGPHMINYDVFLSAMAGTTAAITTHGRVPRIRYFNISLLFLDISTPHQTGLVLSRR